MKLIGLALGLETGDENDLNTKMETDNTTKKETNTSSKPTTTTTNTKPTESNNKNLTPEQNQVINRIVLILSIKSRIKFRLNPKKKKEMKPIKKKISKLL